jgi:hypothetical protein
MKKLLSHPVLAFMVGMGALLLLYITLDAQEVIHHDFLVDADKPYDCLACHDGLIASNIAPCTVNCLFNQLGSHSVFVTYPPAGKESEFTPAGQLEAIGIKLTNGQITCVSCHNLINQSKYHLVMENYRSRLCQACHIR